MISIIRRIKLKNLAIFVFWIAVWKILYLLVNQPLFLASPEDTFRTFITKMLQASTWSIIGNTAIRILAGYFAALVSGAILAAAAYVCPLFEETLRPVMLLIKSIPVASFIVLILAWLSAVRVSGFITGFVVLPMIYFRILEILQKTDRKILEMCYVFHVGFFKKIQYIYTPAIVCELPELLRLTIGMGIRAAIAAELIGVPKNSIGEAIYKAKLYFDISDLFAWTFITILLCFVMEKLMIGICQIIQKAVRHD